MGENNIYSGKIAVAYGDSITKGTYFEMNPEKTTIEKTIVAEKSWCNIVAEKLGFESLTNYGSNGISISSTASVLPNEALSLNYNKLRDDAEVVLIAAGTNDFGTHVKLGENSDMEDGSFCGGLNILCKGLKEKYPDAIIIFITPIERKDADSNEIKVSLDDYRRKISEIAGGIYGFKIVDGRCTGFDAKNPEFIEKYMHDGVHPNQAAHIIYGEAVAKELLKNI